MTAMPKTSDSSAAWAQHWHAMYEITTANNERLRAEAAIMRAALQPFALFADKFDAKPLNQSADALYTIHAGEDAASLRLSDCRAARAALAHRRATPSALGSAQASELGAPEGGGA